MARYAGLAKGNESDWPGLIDNILRRGTPGRAYHIELFHDTEVRDAIAERFGLPEGVSADDGDYERWKTIAVNRFCGFDYVRVGVVGMDFHLHKGVTTDTAGLARDSGRTYQDEHSGPIMTWDDFEAFDWPDPNAPDAMSELEWFQENLPDDMCIIGSGGFAHFAELLTV